MAQLVKCPILDFGSSHDLTVHEFKPPSGSMLTAQSLGGILSFSLSAPLLLVLALKINKLKKKKSFEITHIPIPTSETLLHQFF